MRTAMFLLLIHALPYGCNPDRRQPESVPRERAVFTSYASGFDIQEMENFSIIQVFNPWQNSRNITYTYVLGDDPELVPDSLSGFPYIHTPVSRVVTMSTTHIAMIAGLGEIATIKGASGTPYIFNSEIRERCDSGWIAEVGYGQGLNFERVVALEPDVIFLYGVEGNVTTTAGKLAELGIRVVYCAEYLEQDPLGKAEWIRFFARFYGREREADLLFSRVDSNYTELRSRTSFVKEKPSVMIGLPWKDTWYVAGGNSFASRLISDAGGDYIWHNNTSAEAVPLDLESVFSKAVYADVWINPGVAQSIGDLVAFDERFGDLPVIRSGNIYNNNARMSPGGGNDYWESATIRPDLVLADLIAIFHPQLMRDHSMFYYRKLK